MPEKSVSLSVRLSTDEATFLAGYNPPGATTLSEKIRSIIAETKQRHTVGQNYDDNLKVAQNLLATSVQRLRETEEAHDKHSELVFTLLHWLPDTIAHMMSNIPTATDDEAIKKLAKLEVAAADRVFALMEQVLRLGVTGESPCYDTSIIVNRASTVVKLGEIIKNTSNRE